MTRRRILARFDDEPEPSPLRRARRAKDVTLEQVCAALDQLSSTGSSGVHPSMLSAWERGRHQTSDKYRTMLAAYYKVPVAQLFAHQDLAAAQDSETPRLLLDHRQLHHAMLGVVRNARHYLAVTGSRSRDGDYLAAIESVLAARPSLVHYRILFGPPRHAVLTDHLRRLIDLRDPDDRSLGVKTLHISMVTADIPERFFAANDTTAVVPVPSLTSLEGFDTGITLGVVGARLIDHARQLYAAGQKVESAADLDQIAAP
ncbi:hypothetical protein DFR70_1021042 [Nocardia tenerifensis]|uniref:HTH cro/C1-type domain-containing protein n=1 Tax=Nocardia tenerifensis TaxID=228006 RepID=A0A318K8X9_9NOCA|nr:helix-turn-helix transcriptional regulator [Nocardia tenerifensis]PXX69353.1 hypothetical protein DFR70_1021042 [Nocardia tenerifensis]